MRPEGRWVHQGSLVSFECALGVIGIIRVAGFIRVRPAGHQVHSVSMSSVDGFIGGGGGSSGTSRIVRIIGVRPVSRRVHPWSLGLWG